MRLASAKRDCRPGTRFTAASLEELAAKRTRFGYRWLTAMLVREGIRADHKRVYQLYREEGLAMRNSAATTDPLERRGGQLSGDKAESTLVGRTP